MSKILKKIAGPKVAITVKMDMLELMGQAVADKEMYCVHWTMKGLRGRESTGSTENIRASVSDGASYAVARFADVFAGEVHPKQRKDGSGYEPMEFEMRVVIPALHKKEDKLVGRATVNIFEKVPVLAAGQPAHQAEQTVSISKDGSGVAHIKLSLGVKSGAPVEEELTEPVSPSSEPAPAEPAPMTVKTPPSTPTKEAGSEAASTGVTDEKKSETESRKSRHRKRHSSNSAAMMAAQLKRREDELKQKDEELKQKDERIKQLEEDLKKKDEEAQKKETENKPEQSSTELEELRKHNTFLEGRVKELEQATEKTDVVPLDANQERMQNDLIRLQEDKERLQEEKLQLSEELDNAHKQIEALRAGSADGEKKELELLNQQLAALQEELAKAKKEITSDGAAAPKNTMMMSAIIGAAGAVVGIIIGLII